MTLAATTAATAATAAAINASAMASSSLLVYSFTAVGKQSPSQRMEAPARILTSSHDTTDRLACRCSALRCFSYFSLQLVHFALLPSPSFTHLLSFARRPPLHHSSPSPRHHHDTLQGYYHDSIPAAKDFIGSLPYSTTFSEDPGTFEDFEYLSSFAAILFLHNTDEILTSAQQKLNLASYLRNGGGLIGVHSASAALFDDPWYGQAFGAFFNYHPYFQNATFVVEDDHEHPSTRHLPDQWNFMEEVYNFESDPRDNNVTVGVGVWFFF